MSLLFCGAADSAELDGPYRYTLTRALGRPGGAACWIMLNPSTADGTTNDPTIRRCVGFSRAWGYGSFTVVNLFALRSTDPRGLRCAPDPIGPGNDEAILRESARAQLVVCAWGAGGTYLGRAGAVVGLLRARGTRLHAVGVTRDGHPRHPLYVHSSARPQAWLERCS